MKLSSSTNFMIQNFEKQMTRGSMLQKKARTYQGKKMVPALARRKIRLLFIAVAVFIVIGAAIGGGVGRASSHRKSVSFRGKLGQRSHS